MKGDPHLETALAAAAWLRSVEARSDKGLAWPVDPAKPQEVRADLYHGCAGVLLFLLDAHLVTGGERYRADALEAARYLAGTLPDSPEGADFGLYSGLSGVGYALGEAWKRTGDEGSKAGFLRCLGLVRKGARKAGEGVGWSSSTDVISGGAGIGLFLLWAAATAPKEASGAKELAERAGRRLVELAIPEGGGLKWRMDPDFPRLMPNFSHGTAGVSYFLASLGGSFLPAAVSGARYLLSVAKADGDACLVFHNEPDGRDLYYLGWCHGPAGTARLFHRLHEATGDAEWRSWVRKSANAILQSGAPEKETPGYWNNVGICCGTAGIGRFFLDLYRSSAGTPEDLAFARRAGDHVVKRAQVADGMAKWTHAEHRVRPGELSTQTGWMQGAAGIADFLLALSAAQTGKTALQLPDSPFARRS